MISQKHVFDVHISGAFKVAGSSTAGYLISV